MRMAKLLALAGGIMLVAPLGVAQAGICDLCGLCKPKCDPCKETVTTAACQPCEVKPVKCCTREKQCYTEMKTKWKLVKECVPVCKTKYECRQDPCNPCKTTKVAVQHWDTKTKYRWVCERYPVQKTRTVKVCRMVTPPVVPAAQPACSPCAPAPAVETSAAITPATAS